jgi:hypothetical protein
MRWIEQLRRAADGGGSPGERLARLTREWRRIILEQPELLRLPLVAQLEQGHAEVVREALRTLWERSEGALVEGINESIGAPVADVDLLAHTIFVLLQGAMLRQMGAPDLEQLDRMLQDLQQTVLLAAAARLEDGGPLDEEATG